MVKTNDAMVQSKEVDLSHVTQRKHWNDDVIANCPVFN